jgi:hypothetical protein
MRVRSPVQSSVRGCPLSGCGWDVRRRLLSLRSFIMLCHQYGAGLCMLAMLAEMWSGLEPMHLFYVLDFHAFFVFNCISAVVYIVYWTALLLRSVVAKCVPRSLFLSLPPFSPTKHCCPACSSPIGRAQGQVPDHAGGGAAVDGVCDRQ